MFIFTLCSSLPSVYLTYLMICRLCTCQATFPLYPPDEIVLFFAQVIHLIPEKTVHQRIPIRNQHGGGQYHSPAGHPPPQAGGWNQDFSAANHQAVQYLSPGQMGVSAGYMARDPSSDFDYQSGYNSMAAPPPPPPPPVGQSGIFATTNDGIQQLQGGMGGDFSLYPSSRPMQPPPPPPPQVASFVEDGGYQHGAADFYIPPQPPSLLAYGQPSIFSSRTEAIGLGGGMVGADSAASLPHPVAHRNCSGCSETAGL